MSFLPKYKKSTQKGQALLTSKMQEGQALLIVVLIMAVALVIVLSVASRSTTDVSKTTYDENALRAFSAAEAGVEEALLKNTGTGNGAPVVVDSNANVSYTSVIATASNSDTFNNPEPILSGQSRTFWFVSHAADGSLTCNGLPCTTASQVELCWGAPGTADNQAQTPGVELSLYYDDSAGYSSVASPNNYQNIKIYRFTADPFSSRRSSNNFGNATNSCSYGSYAFSTGDINLASSLPTGCATSGTGGCMIMAKVRSFYNTNTPQPIGMKVKGASSALPPQGVQVDSTGTAGESTRKVSVFRSFSEPQSVFDAGVFSFNDLTK
jgi:hypothetical protein